MPTVTGRLTMATHPGHTALYRAMRGGYVSSFARERVAANGAGSFAASV